MWGDCGSRRCKNGRGSGGRAGREAEWRLSSENIRMGTALGGGATGRVNRQPVLCTKHTKVKGRGRAIRRGKGVRMEGKGKRQKENGGEGREDVAVGETGLISMGEDTISTGFGFWNVLN